jgi:2-acylglycerol O-acyltransferase 2
MNIKKSSTENNSNGLEGMTSSCKEQIIGYKYSTNTSNTSLLKTISGGALLLTFIVVWIASLASPILLYLLMHLQQYYLATAMTSLIICAYLPWEKGIISKYVTAFARCSVFYYRKCTYLFQTPSSLPQEQNAAGTNVKPKFYAIHPHGVFCLGWSILFTLPKMTSVRFCFSPALYASPFFRLWCRLTGKPGRADKPSMVKYMKRKEHIALPPGGFEEATLTSAQHDRVYIKDRFGFIKLALQHGYDVIPVYCFGENATFFNLQGAWKLRLKLNSFGIPGMVAFGSWFCPLLPKRSKYGLYVVCGDALRLPMIENPTREQVKMWHDKYIAALVKVFEDNKCDAYGEEGKTKKLELW